MHYVKHFDINGVDTKQVACIELPSKPNAATEGSVGLLGIDMSSPTHDVYKCVAVNGSIYTWELLSSGLSIMSASISGQGAKSYEYPYANLRTPSEYVVKVGDLILDSGGFLYQIDALGATSVSASYCGTQVVAYGMSAYQLAVEQGFEGTVDEWLESMRGKPGVTPHVGSNGNWWIGNTDTGEGAGHIESGTYVGTGSEGAGFTITSSLYPKLIVVQGSYSYSNITYGTCYAAETCIWVSPNVNASYIETISGLCEINGNTFLVSVTSSGGVYRTTFTPESFNLHMNQNLTYGYTVYG